MIKMGRMGMVLSWALGVVGAVILMLSPGLWAFEGLYEKVKEQGGPGEHYIRCPWALEVQTHFEDEGDGVFVEVSRPGGPAFSRFSDHIRVRGKDPEGLFYGYIRSGGVVRSDYASNTNSLMVVAKALYGFPLRYTEGKKLRLYDNGNWLRFSQHRRVYGLGFSYHCDYIRVDQDED